MELQAASLVSMTNVCVHQAGQPRWEIVGFPTADRWFHVTYEGGDHYNSVELISGRWYLEQTRRRGARGGGPISLSKGRDGRAAPGWLHSGADAIRRQRVRRAREAGRRSRALERCSDCWRRRGRGGGGAAGGASYRGALKGGVGSAQRIRRDRSPVLSGDDWALRGVTGGGRSRRLDRRGGIGRRRRLGTRGDQEARRGGEGAV